MAEIVNGEPPRVQLYRLLLNDKTPGVADKIKKYSFSQFENNLLNNEDAQKELGWYLESKNIVSDPIDFSQRYLQAGVKTPPTPKPKPVPVPAPAPAQQFPVGIAAPESIKGAAPSVTDIGREMAFKPAVQQPIEPVEPVEPIGVMAPEPIVEPSPSVTEVAREMAFKPPVQPKMPKEEEERGFGEWAGDLTGTILEGGKRITKNLLGAVGYFAQTQAATDPMFSLPYEKRQQMMQGAGQTMYNVAEKAQKDFQAEVAKRNIQTDVLQAIENKQYKKVPEAALYTVGDAAMQIIPAVFTMGGSSFMQTLPTAYKDGVEAIAKEKGVSPEQVIASGDDAIITATITSGIVGALDKFGADRIGGFISTKAGYKAVRDWLLKQNVNKTLAKGAQLLGAGIGESGTEYLQEGVGQAGIIAAKSPTMAAFFEKLPDELFTAQAERQRRGAAVGGLIGGTGVAGAGRALTSALSSPKAPGLNKFSDNVVNNEIIQNAARDYQDNIAKAEQQGKKPDSFNQKQLKKISENPEAWVRDEIKYIQQTIESNKTLGLDSKVEENSLAKATSLLNQIKAEKKSMEQADIAPAQEAVPVAPEAEVIAPEGGAPMPQKVKILGKDVNMYNDYIPSRPEDVEPDAMYIFNDDSKDGIPPLLQDVAYANKRESNGVKTENWHASISGEDLLNLYPQTAASPNLIAAPEAAPVAEDIPFEEVPAETEDELAFLDEMRLNPEEEAAILAQEGIIPAAPVAPVEEVAPKVVPAEPVTETPQAGSVGVGGEVEEKVSGLQHTKSQLEEIAKEEGIDNAIASFKKDLSVKENRLAELTKYEKGKLPSQKTKTKEIQSLEKRIEEVRKDVENLEKIKSEQFLKETPQPVPPAAPAPKGRKKAAPVTPAPAAPKKEEAPKPEPKKEEGKPKPTSESQEAAVEVAKAFSDRFGIKVNLIDSKKLQDLLSNSENAKEFFFKVIDKIDVFDSDNIQEAKNFITTVFQTVESAEDAKKAYRKLAVKYHPDKRGSEEVMKHLNDVNDKYQKGTLGAQRTTERPTQASKEQKYREWAERMSRQYEADARAYSQGNAYNAEQQAKESARAQDEKAEREARTKAQQPSGQQAKAGQPKAKPVPAAPTSKIKKGIIESLLEFFTKPFGAEKTTKGEVLTFEARSKYKQDAWNKRNSLKEENRKNELNRINENLKNYTNDKITTKQYRDNETAIRSESSDKNKAVDEWYDNTVAAIDKAYDKKIPFAYKQYVGDKVAGLYDPVSLQAYVVLDNLDETTFVHEAFSHPFIEAVKGRNNELYNNLLAESKSTKEIVDYVNETYGNAPQTVKDAEYIARAIDLDANGKLKNKSLIEYIRQFWNEASKIVKDIFGGKDVKIENIGPKTKISDIVDFVLTSGAKLDLSKAEAEFTSKQESSASQEFDGLKKPSKIKTKSFDGKHGKGAFERMKNITDNFEDIMDGMSGKIKQDCL